MKKQPFSIFITYLILVVGLLLTASPLLWMLITALTPPDALAQNPPAYGRFSLQNFAILLDSRHIIRWSINSLLIALFVTISQTIFNSLAAFGFSAGNFRGKETLFLILLGAMMVPSQIIMLPLFLFMASWQLTDSMWALLLPSMAAPFGIYLIRQYMDSIPLQLSHAAQIDGATDLDVFIHIYFPLSRPILATSAIFIFISQWNAFLWPLVILNSENNYTLTVGLSTLQDQQLLDYGLLMAGATISAIPMVIVFLLFSKHMLEGMRKGAIK